MPRGSQTPNPGGTPASGSFTPLRDSPHPTDPGIREDGVGRKKRKEKADPVSTLHEEMEAKLRMVDVEADDAFEEVIRIFTLGVQEGRYYKTSIAFLRNVGSYMAQLYAFKCDELALERAKRIEHMEELAKMNAEREKEKESLQRPSYP
ncbi:hypothetical protein Pmar_PMAR022049 [Perkinsus marinus ATCC 50983]|uniref:Uncharacterized protein n=1 Tax=Perkinsus marinus (strain ATCC 50983 / TXsc) TaxID=423536 RepID=C5K9A1_PERM5|nr:hypothetical protein Pmar_PMAR022049 [Perkinsus marinus ATCC 50983]EER18942.1 hypothetical protein Pmar_PMAR022049 [Perkinsus marinus ATCC 50983]|eukprot:XP_002787146.1 hypothetical protein Pmar_PMAR022049 [Perkinsus marinus ATCC 50983]